MVILILLKVLFLKFARIVNLPRFSPFKNTHLYSDLQNYKYSDSKIDFNVLGLYILLHMDQKLNYYS
jgi:hypothetical protein